MAEISHLLVLLSERRAWNRRRSTSNPWRGPPRRQCCLRAWALTDTLTGCQAAQSHVWLSGSHPGQLQSEACRVGTVVAEMAHTHDAASGGLPQTVCEGTRSPREPRGSEGARLWQQWGFRPPAPKGVRGAGHKNPGGKSRVGRELLSVDRPHREGAGEATALACLSLSAPAGLLGD